MSVGIASGTELRTKRLRLRCFAVRDAAVFQALIRRPGVADWFTISQIARPIEQWWSALHGRGRATRRYVVTWAESDRLIGSVGISREGQLHYVVDPEFWGQGVATEALRGLLPAAYTLDNRTKIAAEVFDANGASIKVLKKLGFKEEARIRRARASGLHPEPATVYALSRCRFEQLT